MLSSSHLQLCDVDRHDHQALGAREILRLCDLHRVGIFVAAVVDAARGVPMLRNRSNRWAKLVAEAVGEIDPVLGDIGLVDDAVVLVGPEGDGACVEARVDTGVGGQVGDPADLAGELRVARGGAGLGHRRMTEDRVGEGAGLRLANTRHARAVQDGVGALLASGNVGASGCGNEVTLGASRTGGGSS